MRAVLSRDLLASVRHHLSIALPDVGTSRLAECLAAAFGKNTYAALLVMVDGEPESDVLHKPMHASQFHDRLARFGLPGTPAERAETVRIVEQAFVAANAFMANERIYDFEFAGSAEPDAPPHLRLAHYQYLFRWRMRQAGPVNFLVDHLDRIGPDEHLRLANFWQSRRDIDRDIADVLVDWLCDARIVAEGGQRPDWASHVYEGYYLRMLRFMTAATATWRDEDGMPPATPIVLPKRQQRPMRLVRKAENRGNETGYRSTGIHADDRGVAGVAAMAAYRAGWTKDDITYLANQMVDRETARLALTRAFPGSESIDDLLLWMPSEAQRSLLHARVVSVDDEASLEQARIMLEPNGHRRGLRTPPRQDAVSQEVVAWKQELDALVRMDVDVVEIDFADDLPHPNALLALVDVVRLTHMQVLAYRAPALVAASLRSRMANVSIPNPEPAPFGRT